MNVCHTRGDWYPDHCITMAYEGLDSRLRGNDTMSKPTRGHLVITQPPKGDLWNTQTPPLNSV